MRRAALRVADAGHVHTHQLELGAHVGAHKSGVGLAGHVARRHAGHVVAGRHQAEDLLVPARAFADRVHVVIGGAAVAVDRHAAARADGQRALPRQFVARANAGREHDHVGLEVGAVGKHHAVACGGAVGHFERVAAGVHMHSERFDLVAQHTAAGVVDLHRHQPWGELDHVRFEPHVAQCFGALEAEQATAHDHAALRHGARGFHAFKIFDGAVDVAVRPVAARDGRHERERATREHQLVVLQHFACGGGHGVLAPLDGHSARGQAQAEAGALEETGLHERKVFCGLA